MGQSYRQSPSQTHPAAVGNSGDRLEGSRVTERESKLFLSQPLWLSEANPQKPQRRGMTATTKELSRVPELPHQMLLRQKNNNTKYLLRMFPFSIVSMEDFPFCTVAAGWFGVSCLTHIPEAHGLNLLKKCNFVGIGFAQ